MSVINPSPATIEPSIEEALINAAPDTLIALSLEGQILSWNAGAEASLGRSPGEAIGRYYPDFVVAPSHRDAVLKAIEEARETGSARLISSSIHRDGSLLAVDVNVRLMRRADGTARGLAIAERDVTELHRLLAERRSEVELRGLLEAAPDAMVIVGRDGRMLLANLQMEKLFGHTRAELTGMPIELLVPDRFRRSHPQHRNGYIADPRTRPMGAGLDLFALRKDGSEFPAEISLAPLKTADGSFVTAAIRDITDRRRLEEIRRRSQEQEEQNRRLELEEQNKRMQEANRLKSEFVANMSHELRTPLNSVIGFAELMHNGKVGPVSDDHREYLGDILTSSRHLLQLINDVLDLAKVESGKIELRPEPIDLPQVVSEVRDILRGLAAEKHIRVESTVDPRATDAVLDPAKLKQVLYNYISNAVKFTPDNGRVTVRVGLTSDNLLRIDVEDTGIGVRPQDLHRLFVEFQQLDAGTAKRYPGTGLGLALTKRIVEAQGGAVGVTSVEGKGSVFWATLPRTPISAGETHGEAPDNGG